MNLGADAEWTLPAELEWPLPRPVRITGQGILAIFACLFFTAIPVFMVTMFVRDDMRAASDLRHMAAEGRAESAVVTRLWVSHGGKGSTYWHVAYEYRVDGRRYASQHAIPSSHWENLRMGGRLPILYAASDPSIVYPAADPPRRAPTVLWGLMAIFCGLFGAIGAAIAASVLRSRKLLAEGVPACAKVTVCKTIRSRNGVSYSLRYEFTARDGSRCQGKGMVGRQAPEGASITVLYDPNLPRRSGIYPMAMAKLAAR